MTSEQKELRAPNGSSPPLEPEPRPACELHADGSSPFRPCRRQPAAWGRRNRKKHWNRRTAVRKRGPPCPWTSGAARRRNERETCPCTRPRRCRHAAVPCVTALRHDGLHFPWKAALPVNGHQLVSIRLAPCGGASGKHVRRERRARTRPQTAGFVASSLTKKRMAALRPPFVSSLRTKEYSLDQPMERPFEHRGTVLFRLRRRRSKRTRPDR